jgi:hypothetical protein
MRHSLSNLSSGLYASTAGAGFDWSAATAASKISLPRCGKVGTLFDYNGVQVHPLQTANTNNSSGFTMECVYATTANAYNFFGGIWVRWPLHYYGNDNGQYGLRYGLEHYPLNDGLGDTQGRMRPMVHDVGGEWLASRTVHSRVPITDGLPHHVCMTHAGAPTLTDAVKLYVDGVLVETGTLAAGRTQTTLQANHTQVSVYDSWVDADGSVSHVCITPQVLPVAEIQARAALVNGSNVLTDTGDVMVWHAATNSWKNTKGYGNSTWNVIRKP